MKTIIAPIALTFLNCTRICTTILLFLFTLTAHAQMKLEIVPNDSKYAKMQIDCDDQADCDSKLLKWIEKQKFFKGEWKLDPVGGIVSKQELDFESGTPIDHYFHPENFSITLKDITAELATEKAKKEKDVTDLEGIKSKILDGSAKLDDFIEYIKIKEGL